MAQDINRLKVVLAEQKRTNKWLAEQLGKDPASVSKWCTNASQPSLETLVEIARSLNVDVKDLLWSTKERQIDNRKYETTNQHRRTSKRTSCRRRPHRV